MAVSPKDISTAYPLDPVSVTLFGERVFVNVVLPPSYVCLLQTGSRIGANTFWGNNNLRFLTFLCTLYAFDVFFLHVQSFAVHCGYHHFYRKFILFFNLCTGFSDLLSSYDFLFPMAFCFFSI